jgi:DNA helicase-2/ATP-dependent DNA helicase PcrA
MTATASPALQPTDQAIVDAEMALHKIVQEAVREAALATAPDMNAIKSRLIELRDEAITANEHDLPALFQQLYTHHSLAARSFETKLPDMRAPYFAHVRLNEHGKKRDVLIGYQTFIDTKAGITIIDWRHAALAKVFFNYREGDEYELELPGRTAAGILEMRRVISFDIGELVGISSPNLTLSRERGGHWMSLAGQTQPELSGGAGKAVNVQQFGIGATNRRLPDVSALLDPEQYDILNREDQGALLILGGAGSGKTTIALHRMALLSYKRPRFYQQREMQVVVPEQGLVRLTQRLLAGLGLDNVNVATFDLWVTDQGRHILKGLPRRLYDWTPSQVVLIKRHAAMNAVLDAYVDIHVERIAAAFAFLVKGWHEELVAAFRKDRHPLMQRVDQLEQRCFQILDEESKEGSTKWRRDSLSRFFKERRTLLWDCDTARSELYCEPALHAVLQRQSAGQITAKMTTELARHTQRQFEDAHGGITDGVELEFTKTVDDQELEADDYAGTMDVEDFTVLLGWMLRLHGRVQRKGKSLPEYKHLVIDEAQDVGPLELRLLGHAQAADATMTVAGDAVQQSDPTVSFMGWDQVLSELQVAESEEARLNTNYRCPRPVAEFGRKVLGSMAPKELPRSIKEGRDVIFSLVPNEGLAIVAITEALSTLLDHERLASVAIICETEEGARHFFESLRSTCDVRLVIDGEFSFKPGVDITDVSQVKGLEFDYVILPDVNVGTYPDTPVARRSLHIAVTRAVHQLWVLSVGRPSPILSSTAASP